MQWETLKLEKKNHVAILTLNQPETLNAMTFKMKQEFQAAVDRLQNDQEVRVLIIAGEGRSFCSGADIKSTFEMYNDPPAQAQQTVINFYKAFLSIRNLFPLSQQSRDIP